MVRSAAMEGRTRKTAMMQPRRHQHAGLRHSNPRRRSVVLILLVVLLSLGVLIPIVSRSKNELETATNTVHSVP